MFPQKHICILLIALMFRPSCCHESSVTGTSLNTTGSGVMLLQWGMMEWMIDRLLTD